jgi:hypothetical protein
LWEPLVRNCLRSDAPCVVISSRSILISQ